MVTQELDREAEENGGAAPEPFETLRQVAKAVAAAAAVGAAVGAARAFTSRDNGAENGDDEDEQREPQEAQAQLPEYEEEPDHEEEEDDEPDLAAEASQPEPEATAEQPEPELEPQPRAEHDEPEPEPEPEQVEQRENGSEPMQGGTLDETAEIVRRASEQFRSLHEREPESISSLERTDGGWTATFEVVELERIPSSMDVLASYEVALDDQKNMVRYARTRRYYRAQSDREVGS